MFRYTLSHKGDEEHNEKDKYHRRDRRVLNSFLLFLLHVYTCSYLSSSPPQRERTNEGGRREDEGERGKKEERHTVNIKAKPVTPAFSGFSGDGGGGGGGGFAEWGKVGFNVFPFCKMKPADFRAESDLVFWEICSRDKKLVGCEKRDGVCKQITLRSV